MPIPSAEPLGHLHSFCKPGIVGSDSKAAIRGFRQEDRVPFLNIQSGQGFLRQNEPNGISHFAKFQFNYHMEQCSHSCYNTQARPRNT